MTPRVLALAWGLLLALPAAEAARRRAGRVRAVALRPPPSGAGDPDGAPDGGPEGPTGRFAVPERWRRLPLRWSARRADARERAAVVAELPITVDLLAVAIAAGHTPHVAIEIAARWAPPVTGRMLRSVAAACGLGADLDRALDDLAVAHDPLRGLVDALLATERLGAPVLDSLRRVAASARDEVRRRAETRARTVPVRMLFPLVLLVLPAFGLLTVVPTLAARLAA